jgi:hypothetical protein
MEWTRFEKWLVCLWLIAAVWTMLSFFAVGLTSIIMFILMVTLVGIPLAFLLGLLPTVLLYLTGAAPIYLLFRKRSRALGVIVSIVLIGAVGIALPIVVNQKLTESVAAATLHDGGGPVEAPKGGIIAYLSAYGPFGSDIECEDYCQRLLFSGAARAVIRGNVEALAKRPTVLRRYWLGPAEGPCHPAKMTPARASEEDVGRYFPVPFLQQKAQQAYGEGQCFFEAKATLDEADLTFARDDFAGERSHNDGKPRIDLRLFKVLQQRWIATYKHSGTTQKQVMRVSHAVAARLAVPLRLEAPFVFDTYTPGHWATDGIIERGRWAKYGLSEFLVNDVRVRGLTTETGVPLPR